jgi:hypothetical protein
MNSWERRALSERLDRQEIMGPLLDKALTEYSKSAQLFKHNQMFKKWTLGEIDLSTPDSEIKCRLQEYIEYLKTTDEPQKRKRIAQKIIF